ncbi:MAG TPA: hypothetical protein VFQ00_10495 [Terriglobales bacterium]|nr:hypothetical protein [Terriglobales bacterium]
MKLLPRNTLVLFLIALTVCGIAQAQFTIGGGNAQTAPANVGEDGNGPLNPAQPKGITPDQIIQKFAAKEAEFKKARDQYTWTQDVKIQDLDGDMPVGEFREVTDIVYDDSGKRVERVTFAPQPTLRRVSMTKEDMDDIRHQIPFTLTSDELPKYQIIYVGQQHVDELDTYVFDVAPKTIEKGQRYFQGRIWVDNQDLQIVKTYGKSVPDIGVDPKKLRKHPENENLFPKAVTYRQQIDNQYWFPTYSKADDILHFSTGDVHIKIIIKYMNYKRFGTNVKILYGGSDITNNTPTTDQTKPTTASPK